MKQLELVTIERARAELMCFGKKDFRVPSECPWSPYDQVDDWSQGSLILFRRYAAVLNEVAQEKNVPESEVQLGAG